MTRRKNDTYYTPDWLVNEFLSRRLEYGIKGLILEPCCGNGAISNYLKQLESINSKNPIIKVITNDIDSNVIADTHLKAQVLLPEVKDKYDWIITNPPFNQAHEIIPLAYDSAKVGIIMLLRLTYLEPCKNRANWLRNHSPTGLVINKRVSFTNNNKTDNCTTAWFIWDKSNRSSCIRFIY